MTYFFFLGGVINLLELIASTQKWYWPNLEKLPTPWAMQAYLNETILCNPFYLMCILLVLHVCK